MWYIQCLHRMYEFWGTIRPSIFGFVVTKDVQKSKSRFFGLLGLQRSTVHPVGGSIAEYQTTRLSIISLGVKVSSGHIVQETFPVLAGFFVHVLEPDNEMISSNLRPELFGSGSEVGFSAMLSMCQL